MSISICPHIYYPQYFSFPCGDPDFHPGSFSFIPRSFLSHFLQAGLLAVNWLGFNLKSIYSAFILQDIFAEYKILGWEFFFSVLRLSLSSCLHLHDKRSATLPLLFSLSLGSSNVVMLCLGVVFLFVVFLHLLCCEINEPLGSVSL